MGNVHKHSVALFSLLLGACEGPAAVVMSADDAALAQLEADTHQTWAVRRDPILHTPAFLEGRTQPVAATAHDADGAARSFFSTYRALFHMTSSDELASLSSETDELGMTHARFAQRIGPIAVWGGWLATHFDVDGALVRVNGRYIPIEPPASMTPTVTEQQARVASALLIRGQRPLAVPDSTNVRSVELVLFPVADSSAGTRAAARLAWHTITEIEDANDPVQLDALIDAETGQALASYDRIETVVGSGVDVFGQRKPLVIEQKKTAYWLEDRTRGDDKPIRTFSAANRIHLPGSQLRSSHPDSWDDSGLHGVRGAAVDAHANIAVAWDYFLGKHHRAGFRGDGAGVRAIVHYGVGYANAFYDGSQLVFGDGDTRLTTPAAALDFVAHEFSHGVIDATAGLVPVGESGAIGEGMADVFACLAAWDSGQGGRWQIGETVFHPTGLNRPLRDLAHPHETGQPVHVSELDPATDDRVFIHTNASIVGHLAYLLVEGDGEIVHALGADATGRIFYRALVSYLFPRAGFAELADAIVSAARDLDVSTVPEVEAALTAVGLR